KARMQTGRCSCQRTITARAGRASGSPPVHRTRRVRNHRHPKASSSARTADLDLVGRSGAGGGLDEADRPEAIDSGLPGETAEEILPAEFAAMVRTIFGVKHLVGSQGDTKGLRAAHKHAFAGPVHGLPEVMQDNPVEAGHPVHETASRLFHLGQEGLLYVAFAFHFSSMLSAPALVQGINVIPRIYLKGIPGLVKMGRAGGFSA